MISFSKLVGSCETKLLGALVVVWEEGSIDGMLDGSLEFNSSPWDGVELEKLADGNMVGNIVRLGTAVGTIEEEDGSSDGDTVCVSLGGDRRKVPQSTVSSSS